VIGVKAEFVGIADDGQYLAKSLRGGKFIQREPIPWRYCFPSSIMKA
jgi:hypothetical protein